jgi:hypothetical protein
MGESSPVRETTGRQSRLPYPLAPEMDDTAIAAQRSGALRAVAPTLGVRFARRSGVASRAEAVIVPRLSYTRPVCQDALTR